MKYCQFAPGVQASQFVECFWTLEDDSGAIQRIVPDGYPALILNLRNPFESFDGQCWRTQPVCFNAGQTTGPLLIRSRGAAQILGVGFQPQGASALLGLPIDELTDAIVPVVDASPVLWRELQPVFDAGPGLTQITTLESSLLRFAAQATPDELVTHAVGRLVDTGGGLDIGHLASRLGLSVRQLQRRFRQRVGISPKLFSRIQRFQGVFHLIDRDQSNWADAAIACGYYDQAHLIRDFRQFAGEPPAALLQEADLARHFLRHTVMSHLSNTPRAASL